jgi:N utilization substance protein B
MQTGTHMGTRRKSREAALQYLFQEDFIGTAVEGSHEELLEDRFSRFCSHYQISRKARPYAFEILQGILFKRDEVDAAIREHATNWRLERIAVTDRNLLRVGVYEMLFSEDVPPQVAINEAVEIAKRFGSDDSPSFVNGVLDAVQSSRQQTDKSIT